MPRSSVKKTTRTKSIQCNCFLNNSAAAPFSTGLAMNELNTGGEPQRERENFI
jgi:hypothetical protein